jgi:hypothetical protein
MRGDYRTPIYTLKAQKAYRERNSELLAERARERYMKNKEAVLQRRTELRDIKRSEEGLPPIIRNELNK